MRASMHEAKSDLSRLVKRALAGEEVILTTGKSRTPLVRIVPVDAEQNAAPVLTKRPLGIFASEMGTGDYDWTEPMSEEELALWEAPIVSTWTTNEPEPEKGE